MAVLFDIYSIYLPFIVRPVFFFLYFLCFVRPSPVTEKLWVAIFFMV